MYKNFIILILSATLVNCSQQTYKVKSYGGYQKMIHTQDASGKVDLSKATSSKNTYAVGALADGLGEITILNDKVYLDYGKDGLGNSLQHIPQQTQAVLLATTQVKQWQTIHIANNLSQQQLFTEILDKAKSHGIDIGKPFPFILEGEFETLKIHVIAGRNPKFAGHGKGEKFFHMDTDEMIDEKAIVVGFYSASNQGVYTHPNESWHLHAIIEDISAHIDRIKTGKGVILKLPLD